MELPREMNQLCRCFFHTCFFLILLKIHERIKYHSICCEWYVIVFYEVLFGLHVINLDLCAIFLHSLHCL